MNNVSSLNVVNAGGRTASRSEVPPYSTVVLKKKKFIQGTAKNI